MANHNTINAYFDGACGPVNPGGTIGLGMNIIHNTYGKAWHDGHKQHEDNTNNVAEYMALIAILEHLEEAQSETISIKGDSMLVIMQMTGRWKIKTGMYKEYALWARRLLDDLKCENSVEFTWIPREKNTVADELSKLGLNENL